MPTVHATWTPRPPAAFLAAIVVLWFAPGPGLAADPATSNEAGGAGADALARGQVPAWSSEDLEFFLHGSMSTEVVPEAVLQAFIRIYPDLFPARDLSPLGLIPDPAFGWPIGFSRAAVPHLGGLTAVGINCAACHVGEITGPEGARPMRLLGVTSHFDVEAFFGALIVSTFRTADPTRMREFLEAYLDRADAATGSPDRAAFRRLWQQQEHGITNAIAADPAGAAGLDPGALNELRPGDLADGMDLSALARSMLKLFHNMRAALHVPDQPPAQAAPPSGPGRNDAFGLLSAVLFGAPQPYAPVKYGLVWDVDHRHWVHWDGNTQSPIGRNLLASLGLGAPLIGRHGQLEYALVKRHTDLSETIRPPRYPFPIDQAAAERGAAQYQARCASCHDTPEGDQRLYSVDEIGTDPGRARLFTPLQAERFNQLLANLETPGYTPAAEPGLRSTQKYWAPSLPGVWARSPYLHNGSVLNLQELLTPAAARRKTFQRGSRAYDPVAVGYQNAGSYRFDTSTPGNSNAGHEYGTDLAPAQRCELLEYLKTL